MIWGKSLMFVVLASGGVLFPWSVVVISYGMIHLPEEWCTLVFIHRLAMCLWSCPEFLSFEQDELAWMFVMQISLNHAELQIN